MSTLYGAVDLGKPERQEFFGETRKMIQDMVTLRESEDAAEKLAMESSGIVPPISSSGLYQRDFDAAIQMANILKERKDDFMGTEEGRLQYQQGLDQLSFFLEDRKKYYNTTHPILVQNTRLKQSGTNPQQWASQGLMDGRTMEEYVAKTTELDTNRFSVKFDGGSFVLSDATGDYDINDPSLVDLSWFDESNYLVQTQPVRPQDFYNVNRPKDDTKIFEDRNQVVDWVAATIMSDTTGLQKRDAVRWFVDSDANTEGLTEQQILDAPNAIERAVDAYAEAAVQADWKAFVKKTEEKKGKEKDKQKENLDALISGVQEGMSVETTVNGEPGSVRANYAPLYDANIYIGSVEGEDVKYRLDGIYVDDEGRPIFALITSQGTVFFDSDFDDDLFKEIESKMSSKYGEQSLTKLIKEMV